MKKSMMKMKEPQTCNCWIFIFGSGHVHEGKYVAVYGKCGEARRKMADKYGYTWAFQYSIDDWQTWLREKPWYVSAETELETIQ